MLFCCHHGIYDNIMAITGPLILDDASEHRDNIYKQAAWHFGLKRDAIESVLLCTSFQCDVIDCAADDGRRAIGHVVYELPSHVDLDRLAAAWKEVTRQTAALRTCIFKSKTGDYSQVILSKSFTWAHLTLFETSLDTKESVVQDEAGAGMTGPRCNRYVVLRGRENEQRVLIWTFSHALVDRALRQRVLQQVQAIYDGCKPQISNHIAIPPKSQGMKPEDAAQFWQEHFDGLSASIFPTLPSQVSVPRPDSQLKHRISYQCSAQQTWSNIAICRAALAVLLARATHAEEVLFGVLTERPHMSDEGDHPVDGSTRALTPMRVFCDPDQSVSDVMEAVTTYDNAMRSFGNIGLCNIRRAGEDASAACGFQTILLITSGDASQTQCHGLHRTVEEPDDFTPFTNRALLLRCHMLDDSAILTAQYDQSVMDELQMARFLRQLGSLIQQFLGDVVDLPLVGQLNPITEEDKEEIANWNSKPPRVEEGLIHDLVAASAVAILEKVAVSAWDGDWTYAELETVSSRLAAHIQKLDLSQGQDIVPLCFEKSKWVAAGMLAVLKSGRAFTLIDPSLPQTRIAQICRQTSATFVLTSKLHLGTMNTVVDQCILIDDDAFRSFPGAEDWIKPAINPRDLAYVLFTSGSTGEPKGAMIEHQAFVSRVFECGRALGINSDTRSLQFASYAFGSFMVEIIVTLIHGGCTCIPSEDDRMNNVPGFIRKWDVNWALLTPSFITTIDPYSVPGLRTLASAGEPISASLRDTWAPRVQLLNAYGLSEVSIICSATKISPLFSEPRNVCRAVAARYWVVDPNEFNRLAPIGCIGELVIESPGVARGYIVAPPQGSSRFISSVPDWYPSRQLPDGIKFYRTGDLVCYRSDGSVLYLGRADSQVKIRGQRVETGEVETRLREQSSDRIIPVVEAIKRSGPSGDSTHLIAFLIESSKGARDMDARLLDTGAAMTRNKKLQLVLPQHSIPAYYVLIGYLPQTATGKTDRRRLRSIANKLLDDLFQSVTPESAVMSNSSVTSLEAKLKELWYRGLDLDPNSDSKGANFFELGGSSIMAMKMVNMARLADIDLKVTDIFKNPTLADLTRAICSNSSPHAAVSTTTYEGYVEQSFSQGRLWFLEQLQSETSSYLISCAVRMRGTLNIDALSTALLALEKRHETLRTTFEEQDGVGMQVVHASCMNKLRVVDVSDENGGYLQALQKEQTTPFDLTSEAGWRVSLIRLEKNDHIISIVMHHIISDGWSVDVLCRELSQFYTAALRGRDPFSVVKPLSINYRDFSVWQRQEAQAAEHQRQLEYWTTQLVDSSPAELLADLPRPKTLSGQAGSVPVTIEGELYEKLLRFSKAHKATSFAVLLAAFRAAHYRLTSAEDATIGAPNANRNRPELEDMIGFFVNTQCMRITVKENDTFESLVLQVKSTVAASFEHQDVPFDRVVSAVLPGARDMSRNPLVQLIFAMHSQQDLGKFELEGLEAEPIASPVTTRFDAEFHLFQRTGKLTGQIVFAADLFKLENIQNVVDVFKMTLRQGLDQAQTPIAVLPLTDGLTSIRTMGLLEIERTDYPRESSVVDVFSEQVSRRSEALAVTDSSSRLTYAELDHQSDQLAKWLRRRNMAAETVVGVLAPRSCQTIIAFLGILKANLAYLPLDVRAPTARLETILSALPGKRHLILCFDPMVSPIQLPGVELVRISDILKHCDTNGLNGKLGSALERPSATSLAHVIFTSGSTGKPKGVMIEHRNIVRLARASIPRLPSTAKVAHLSNIAFDAATWEIYSALLNGESLVCIDYMTSIDSKALDAVFAREQVRAALLTPALLKQCLTNNPDMLTRLDVLISGGDRLDGQDAIAAKELVRNGVYNAYGPTENGVISAIYNVSKNDSFTNGVPIGRAISNSGAYIMDPQQQLVPIGVMGELVVTGDGLARGYTDPTFDMDRFVQVTIDGQLMRAYRTGDRARYRPEDGQIEFFGRMDQQIKIRGHRIEPAEVERAMLEDDLVRDAVIVIRNQEGQGAEMIGFALSRGDPSIEQNNAGNHDRQFATRIRERLQGSLPSYMVPARIVVVDQMPLNSSGKVDRKELTRRAQVLREPETASTPVPVVPRDEIEAMVCEEFSDVLGVDVGLTDNFFKLGGHSLLATKLAARVGRRLDVRVSVKDIFDHPVPGQLANKLKLTRSDGYSLPNGLQAESDSSFQLLGLEDPQAFVQQELYPQLKHPHDGILDVYPATRLQKRYLHYPLTGNPWPLAPFNIDFPADTNLASLIKASKSLVEYFDCFRTFFLPAAGELYQVVLKHLDVPIEVIQTDEDINDATNAFLDRTAKYPVTLQEQPMLRISILRKRGAPLRVILRMNHVCYDALSLEHMLQALHALYNGNKPAAPPQFVEYMQHAANSRKGGYEFWRSVLQNSSMTIMEDVRGNTSQQATPVIGTYVASKAIDVSLQAGAGSGITQATVFTTACAFMLSMATGSRDIVFGRLVSGRQGLPVAIQNLVGPCTNQIPVRVRLDGAANSRELLAQVQGQYINSIPFETLGFDEIKDNCTSWPDTVTNYSCNVAYQSFDAHPQSLMQGQRVQMGVLPQRENLVEQGLIHDVNIIGDVDIEASRLQITIFVSRRVCEDEERAKNMLEELCGRIQSLNSTLRDSH